jgi:hypothetical protein
MVRTPCKTSLSTWKIISLNLYNLSTGHTGKKLKKSLKITKGVIISHRDNTMTKSKINNNDLQNTTQLSKTNSKLVQLPEARRLSSL